MKKYTEDNLQSACAIYFNNTYCLKHHDNRGMVFQIPNESATKLAMTLKAKGMNKKIIDETLSMLLQVMRSMGFLDGVSDTIILYKGIVHFVEFKLPGNNQQDNQVQFQQRVEAMGFPYHIMRSLEQFKLWAASL